VTDSERQQLLRRLDEAERTLRDAEEVHKWAEKALMEKEP
jgi:hypothetical protein